MMKVGDLVKLKGFELTDPNDIPHGFIVADLGLNKYKIRWLNPELATRWAMNSITPIEKLELIVD
tara:strand:- start:1418 stop:1612 length:195 start_codon:yes stop_codon:yes gene_type:complete